MTLSGYSANLVAINVCAKSQKDADTEGVRIKIDFDALYLASTNSVCQTGLASLLCQVFVWGACVLFTCQVCVCGVLVGSIVS